MAEAAAAIALIASIASLIDLSAKIVSRVKDYSAQTADVPNTFRSLADRLPLLTQTLKHIQSRAQAGSVTAEVAQELDALVNSIREQVELLNKCLEGLIPSSSSSRLDRVLLGVKSVAKDEKVKHAVEKIHHGIDVLVLHQTTSTIEVSDRILRELSRLSLQELPLPKPASHPPAQQALGLCLGQAPLIDPDAFVGRQTEIQQLHAWLSSSTNAQPQRVMSIVGMGGLGKTQLSLAYIRQHGHHFSSVFWLSARNRTILRQSMAALTAVVFTDTIHAAVNADEESDHVERVRRWLSEPWNDRWLIVLDNYDDPSLPNITSHTGFDIRHFFPTRAHGSILVTTRSSKLAFSKQLKLPRLQDLDLCLAILSQRSGRDMFEDSKSRQLAERLDGLPLALAMAGTYLAQTDVSCAEYLDFYESAWNDLHGAESEELMEYERRTLSSTWTISLDQVRLHDPDAAQLFQFLGYLNNEDIWYELIKAGAVSGPSWMSRVTTSKIRFGRAMSRLADYSLVEAQNRTYRVHPCLHDWILEYLNCPPDKSLFLTVIACLEQNILNRQHTQYWSMGQRIINHVNRIRHQKFVALWDSSIDDINVLRASHWFGSLYKDLCELSTAKEMYTRVLTGLEKVLGPDHISTLVTVNDLGVVYYRQGKQDESEQMYQRALVGFEKALGPDHTWTLMIVNNLSIVYYEQGKQDEAEQMIERAVAVYEKALGPDNNATLKAVINLSVLYRRQDKLGEAEQILVQAIAQSKKALGPNHTSTLSMAFNLGAVYYEQGKLGEAELMYQQALTGYEQNSQASTIPAIDTVFGFGLLYQKQGRLFEAEQWLQRAVQDREKMLGPSHPSASRAANALRNLRDQMAQEKQHSGDTEKGTGSVSTL